LEMEFWIMPLHVAPVVSFDELKKCRIARPRSGMDRFNLTDVGEALIVPYLAAGHGLRFGSVDLPYPWKIELGSTTTIEAIRVGNSTFRSILKVVFDLKNGFSGSMRRMISELDRDPLETPYWDMKSWETFHRESGRTKDQLTKVDSATFEALGIKRPAKSRRMSPPDRP